MLVRLTLLLLECLCRTSLVLGLLLFVASSAYGQHRQRAEEENCHLEPGGESIVLAITGPQTLHLADGRMVHLAEVFTPASAERAGLDPSSNATAYLRSTALGRKVEVKFGGSHHDRYGVTIAHIFVAGERPLWLQEGLVNAGLAQAFPQPDNHTCSKQLASIEEKARDENRGYWGLALFRVLPARETRSILNVVQTYQIVEGDVTFVTHAAGRTTLHFAENSKASFTATLEPAAQRRLSEPNPDDWQGEKVRIRGWIERKKGPTITIIQPEQIEVIQQEPPKSAPDSPR